ncbi:MAG TPA: nuclear transport factor 2 family protein [Flavobacteriales bacterium]
MRILSLPFAALLVLSACQRPDAAADAQAIREVMDRQQRDWNEGDILGFMDGYADSVCFLGRKGRTCGRTAVTAQYIRNYPDTTAMGKLTFSDLEVLPAGNHAWCTGKWQLVRNGKEPRDTLGGGFSLYWQRGNKGWRILRDHTY